MIKFDYVTRSSHCQFCGKTIPTISSASTCQFCASVWTEAYQEGMKFEREHGDTVKALKADLAFADKEYLDQQNTITALKLRVQVAVEDAKRIGELEDAIDRYIEKLFDYGQKIQEKNKEITELKRRLKIVSWDNSPTPNWNMS